jgi:hypothetical protein
MQVILYFTRIYKISSATHNVDKQIITRNSNAKIMQYQQIFFNHTHFIFPMILDNFKLFHIIIGN